MKTKITLTLPEDLLASLTKLAGPRVSRAVLIEQVLRDFVEQRTHEIQDANDTAAINSHAAMLNAEMRDVLTSQHMGNIDVGPVTA